MRAKIDLIPVKTHHLTDMNTRVALWARLVVIPKDVRDRIDLASGMCMAGDADGCLTFDRPVEKIGDSPSVAVMILP